MNVAPLRMPIHYAMKTKITPLVQLKAYLEFRQVFADTVDPYPCGSDQLCMYMSYLARRMCYSSIRQYLSGLNNHLKDVGCSSLDYKNHRVCKCLAGIRRTLQDAPKQAPPLAPVVKIVRTDATDSQSHSTKGSHTSIV